MRVSLLITACSEQDLLRKTLASAVEACAGLAHEILLITDGMSDTAAGVGLRPKFPGVRTIPGGDGRVLALDQGVRAAAGEVVIFLDAPCLPEPDSLAQLAEAVVELEGEALVLPRIRALSLPQWRGTDQWVGHGAFLEMETLDAGWLDLDALRPRGRFYESPALLGPCWALARRLYEDLGGLETALQTREYTALELGLRAWLSGSAVLHDPAPSIAAPFRAHPGGEAPLEVTVADRLRMARKHFTDSTWAPWLDKERSRQAPEIWKGAWARFERGRTELEGRRIDSLLDRVRSESWYAETFHAAWPPAAPGGAAAGTAPLAHLPPGLVCYRSHLRRPRNAGELPGANLTGSVEDGLGRRATLAVRVVRQHTGKLLVERARYRYEGAPEVAAYLSLLTVLLEGQPLPVVRALTPKDLRAAFAAGPEADPEAALAVTAWQRALGDL